MKIFIIACLLGVALGEELEVSSRGRNSGRPDHLNFDCIGRDDGLYADLIRGCHQYYECGNGDKSTLFCDEGMIFNEKVKACVPKSAYECPHPQFTRELALELIERGRNSGRPDYLNFDCEGKQDGLYADRMRGCHQFYECKDEEKSGPRFCKDGNIFFEKIRACVPETLGGCANPKETRELKLEVSSRGRNSGRPDHLNFDCAGRDDGLYADLIRGCHQYYECGDGDKSTLFCDEGKIFNEKVRACVPKSTYECPHPQLTRELALELIERGRNSGRPDYLNFDCEGKKDGLYADRMRGCHQFYECKDEEKSGPRFCKDGYIFFERIRACVPKALARCPEPQETNELEIEVDKKTPSHGAEDWLVFKCDGREDGYYADRVRACKQFYHCEAGVKTTMTCPGSTIFNEQIAACSPTSLYSCPPYEPPVEKPEEPTEPTEDEPSCANRKDEAFYPYSACAKFFRCVHGLPVKFACPPGTKFDTKLNICNFEANVTCSLPKTKEVKRAVQGDKAKSERTVQRLRQLLRELQKRKH